MTGSPASARPVTLVLACLDKDPERRPASALALRDSLINCVDAGGWTHARADEWWEEHGGVIARVHAETGVQEAVKTIAVDLERR